MRVWLIDDSQADLYLLQRAVLEACPQAQITTFSTLSSAIDRWAESSPDCVFVDLNLGADTGLDLVDAIDDAPERAPAVNVVISGVAAPEQLAERLRRARVPWQVRAKPLRAHDVIDAFTRAGYRLVQ